MNDVKQQLEEIINCYPYEEKILIAPSYAAGRMLLESCVNAGMQTINLKISTLLSIAESIAGRKLSMDEKIVSSAISREILFKVIMDIKAEGRLEYFNNIKISSGFCQAFYQTIMELKMAAKKTQDIDHAKLVNHNKAHDIKIIWQGYDRAMKGYKFLDKGDVYKLAIANYSRAPKAIYITLSNIKMSKLEKSLYLAISNGMGSVIEMNRPSGLVVPENTLHMDIDANKIKRRSKINPMLYLYDIKSLPLVQLDTKHPLAENINMFRAQGEINEVRGVLSDIKMKGINFDQVAIYYIDKDPYAHLFYNLCQGHDIPITFGQGFNISYTNPGSLFKTILRWIEDDFSVKEIVPAFINGILRPTGDMAIDGISSNLIGNTLRDSSVIRGISQYRQMVTRRLNELETEVKEYQKAVTIWLDEIFLKHLERFPMREDGAVNFSKLVKWVHYWIENFSAVINRYDAEAKSGISDSLKLIEDLPSYNISLRDALSRLEDYISGMSVGFSIPEPGKLHIDHYSNGIYMDRAHNYFVGLSSNNFPGKTIENPVLLDIERRRLDPSLERARDSYREKIYTFTQTLSTAKTYLNFSYCAFDILDGTENIPAPILLQIARLKDRLCNNDRELNYKKLCKDMGKIKGFIPIDRSGVLNRLDWWLWHIDNNPSWAYNNFIDTTDISIAKTYERFIDSLKKEYIEIDYGIGTHKESDVFLSSTQLERLGTCPYSYFLIYILGIRPLEPLERDIDRWLDPLEKGTLYHTIYDIYSEYVAELTKEGKTIDDEKRRKLLFAIAQKVVAEKEREQAAEDRWLIDRFKVELSQDLEVFLDTEREMPGRPIGTELSFGMGGESKPAILIWETKKQGYYLRGRIDRVNETEDGLHIWDYKTGSTYNYEDDESFKGGRQLQHALYAAALEKLWPDKKVINSGYLFPTVRGKGTIIMRYPQDAEYIKNHNKILSFLIKNFEEGKFMLTDNDKDCTFCDYKEVCNKDLIPEDVSKKFKELLKEMRGIK